MNAVIKQFQNDLLCVSMYAQRMRDRLKVLRDIGMNTNRGPVIPRIRLRYLDLPTWIVTNDFLDIPLNNVDPLFQLTKRGEEYLKILESAEGDSGSMYFNSTTDEKNMNDAMKGHPTFSECSLYEDVTHYSPSAKLADYLNPNNTPFDGTWVSYDGNEYTRK